MEPPRGPRVRERPELVADEMLGFCRAHLVDRVPCEPDVLAVIEPTLAVWTLGVRHTSDFTGATVTVRSRAVGVDCPAMAPIDLTDSGPWP